MLRKVAFISLVTASALFASLPNLSGKIIRVDANGISEDKVKAATGVREGDAYSIGALQAAQHNLEMALKQAGYVDAKVTVDAIQKDDGIKVKFNVDKGDPIKVKKVTFIGNHVLSSDVLESAIVNKPGGMFSWLTGGGEAVPAMLEYDQAKVRDEYLKRGYLDVQVDKPLMKTDFASKTATVTFTIRNEGQPYTVSSIQAAPIPDVDMTEAQKEFELKQGKVFNVEELQEESKRFKERDISPTGLISGKKSKRSQRVAGIIEAEFDIEIEESGSRRYAWVFPDEIKGEYIPQKAHYELEFYLPKGSYATNVVDILKGSMDRQ